jgi:hypothetical protein
MTNGRFPVNAKMRHARNENCILEIILTTGNSYAALASRIAVCSSSCKVRSAWLKARRSSVDG